MKKILKALKEGLSNKLFNLLGAIIPVGEYQVTVDVDLADDLSSTEDGGCIATAKNNKSFQYYQLPVKATSVDDDQEYNVRISLTRTLYEQLQNCGEQFNMTVEKDKNNYNVYSFSAITDKKPKRA